MIIADLFRCADRHAGHISTIDAASDTVIATIPEPNVPFGVAVTPDGSKVDIATPAYR
jgi:YVTN family beta-propeller protein